MFVIKWNWMIWFVCHQMKLNNLILFCHQMKLLDCYFLLCCHISLGIHNILILERSSFTELKLKQIKKHARIKIKLLGAHKTLISLKKHKYDCFVRIVVKTRSVFAVALQHRVCFEVDNRSRFCHFSFAGPFWCKMLHLWLRSYCF